MIPNLNYTERFARCAINRTNPYLNQLQSTRLHYHLPQIRQPHMPQLSNDSFPQLPALPALATAAAPTTNKFAVRSLLHIVRIIKEMTTSLPPASPA